MTLIVYTTAEYFAARYIMKEWRQYKKRAALTIDLINTDVITEGKHGLGEKKLS